MLDFLLKHLPEVAVALSLASIALMGGVLAVFLKPKISDIEATKNDLGKLKEHIDTLKLEKKIEDLGTLSRDFATLTGGKLVSRLEALETRVFSNIIPDLAELKSSELNRNDTLKRAIDVQAKFIKKLEAEIRNAIEHGDKITLRELYETRVGQLETAYVIARMRGGIEEAEALAKWKKSQDELARVTRESHQS